MNRASTHNFLPINTKQNLFYEPTIDPQIPLTPETTLDQAVDDKRPGFTRTSSATWLSLILKYLLAGIAYVLGVTLLLNISVYTPKHRQAVHEGGVPISIYKTSGAVIPLTQITLPNANRVSPIVIAKPATGTCAINNSGKLPLISISQRHLWACDGRNVVNQNAVTTGTTAIINGVDDNTPLGTWHIYKKTNESIS